LGDFRLLVLKAAGPEASVKAPIIVFVLPIILSAYVAGLAPGLVSTMLAVPASIYFILLYTEWVNLPASLHSTAAFCAQRTQESWGPMGREEQGTGPFQPLRARALVLCGSRH
jgi:hypothetical protein